MVILGATGSIGSQALDYIKLNPTKFRLLGATCGKDIFGLLRIAKEFSPKCVGIGDESLVPALTEERRRELIKKAKASGENSKIVIRNARRDAVEFYKKAQKNEGMPEDTQKEGEAEVQKLTDKFVKKIDELISAKEKEILTV